MDALFEGITAFTTGHLAMLLVGSLLIYLGITHKYEPLLLLPIGFGAILANIPLSVATGPDGWLTQIYQYGILNELFPILLFVGIGAMMDFGPLLARPVTVFYGAAAQIGIFVTIMLALALDFSLHEAVSIGIIGAADGPTSIYVSTQLAPHYLPAISVAAYSYMALVPLIQPPIIRALTLPQERRIPAPRGERKPPRIVRILFPIVVTILAGIITPVSTELIGALMFGNLLRESKVTERLSATAQNELSNLVTLLLGVAIGSTMQAQVFLTRDTLMILGIGLIAFALDTVGGVLFARLLNRFLLTPINPMVGAAGISAFPMSARVVNRLGLEEDPANFLLMQAAGANVAGQLGSVVAGSVLITLLL